MVNPQPVTLFLIDQDADHAAKIESNFRQLGILNTFQICDRGKEAQEYLFNCWNQDDAVYAPLVFLTPDCGDIQGLDLCKALQEEWEKTAMKKHGMGPLPIVMLAPKGDKKLIEACKAAHCPVLEETNQTTFSRFCKDLKNLGLSLQVTLPPKTECS